MNLGSVATDAALRLKNNPDWIAFKAGLEATAGALMNASLASPPEARLDATAYARAVRDVWIAVEAATTATGQRGVAKPGVRFRAAEVIAEGII